MKNLLFSLVCLFSISIIPPCYSQSSPNLGAQSPSVSSLMRFEEIPVGTYTGVPNVSIPLFQLPSRSKDIGLDLTLAYHPSSVAASNAAGDVGLGWSLFSSGVVSRDLRTHNIPDEVDFKNYPDVYQDGSDLFQYSVQGITGRFYLTCKSGLMRIKIIESKPSAVSITMDYNNLTLEINSFTIRDDNGNKYVFDNYETKSTKFMASQGNPWSPTVGQLGFTGRSTWFLSAIYDKNNKLLMSYTYNSYNVPTSTSPNPNYDIHKNLNTITVDGKGKAEFLYSYGNGTMGNINGNIAQISIKSLDNETKRKYNFSYESASGRKRLVKLEESGSVGEEKHTHSFEYLDLYDYSGDLDVDRYDYYKRGNQLCDPSPAQRDATDTLYCKLGVLNKIKYPTGGFTEYEYESNTYSYPEIQEYDYSGELHNIHKEYIYNDFDGWPGGLYYQFTITEAGTYYVKVNVPPTYNPGMDDGSGNNISYSRVKIKSIPGTGGITPTFSDGIGTDLLGSDQQNDNDCYGRGAYLVPGSYKFEIIPTNFQVNAQVVKKSPNTVVQKLVYGGGIRIKEISMYTRESDTLPAKKTMYSYQMFDNPLQSSGSVPNMYDFDIISGTNSPKKEMVGYKNVTVTEPGKGRTEYSYLTSDDFQTVDEGIKITPYYDYKTGLPVKKEVYDEQGRKLHTSEISYVFDGDTIHGPGSLYERNGYVQIKTAINKNYVFNGTNQKMVQTKTIEGFTSHNNIVYTITNADATADAIKTQYSYWPIVAAEGYLMYLEKVQDYKGNELISTQKTVYAAGNSPNASHLPSYIQSSKGNRPLENKVNFVSYDEFSNPLEVKQVNGVSVAYIWGYNKTQVIAMIENATYASISTSLITAAQNASNGTNEADLITALNNIRIALPNANCTTYTYKPLVGVSSITNPAGDKITYHYDNFGRLQFVKDHDNNILSENEYHYRPLSAFD